MNTKKANRGYLTKERYVDMLIKVNNCKNKSREIKPTDCQRLKRYHVIKIDNVEKRFFPLSKDSSYVIFYV